MNAVRVYRHGLRVGWTEFKIFWTPTSWVGGWMVRIVAQAAFFALLGRLLDSPERLEYLVIGNAVVVGALAVNWTVPSSTWDRGDGTYPLLVISPSSLLPAIMGRTSVWLGNGIATSLMSLLVLVVLFDIEVNWPSAALAVPLVVVSCVSVYCLALLLGSIVTRRPRIRNVVHNTATTLLMAFCGVSVPVAFWPGWIEVLAHFLPLTHGLEAIRVALAGGPLIDIVRNVGLEVSVGAGWLALSLLTIDRMADGGRLDGSIEFMG